MKKKRFDMEKIMDKISIIATILMAVVSIYNTIVVTTLKETRKDL